MPEYSGESWDGFHSDASLTCLGAVKPSATLFSVPWRVFSLVRFDVSLACASNCERLRTAYEFLVHVTAVTEAIREHYSQLPRTQKDPSFPAIVEMESEVSSPNSAHEPLRNSAVKVRTVERARMQMCSALR